MLPAVYLVIWREYFNFCYLDHFKRKYSRRSFYLTFHHYFLGLSGSFFLSNNITFLLPGVILLLFRLSCCWCSSSINSIFTSNHCKRNDKYHYNTARIILVYFIFICCRYLYILYCFFIKMTNRFTIYTLLYFSNKTPTNR